MSSANLDEAEIKRRMDQLLSFENKKEKEEFDELVFHFRVMNEIKDILKKREWNKKRLAEGLGTSQSFISQLFNGNKIINSKLISKIERLLEIRFTVKAEDIRNESEDAEEVKRLGNWTNTERNLAQFWETKRQKYFNKEKEEYEPIHIENSPLPDFDKVA